MYDYAHTPLDKETIRLTSFSSGDKFLLSYEAFMVLRDFPIFSQNKCRAFLNPL